MMTTRTTTSTTADRSRSAPKKKATPARGAAAKAAPAKKAPAKKVPAKAAPARRSTRPRKVLPPPPALVAAVGPDVAPALLKYLTEAKRPDGSPRYDIGELSDLTVPLHHSPPPSPETRLELGLVFDLNQVDRFLRFCRSLRHIKGSTWAGTPLELDLWQVVFVVAPLFGWRRADGTRLYRTLFLEVPRKNGKTTLASALALYALAADREPGAEVYAAAKDRHQAGQCFDPAAAMVKASRPLSKRLQVHKTSITNLATASFFKVLPGELRADSQHGLNVHTAVVDELHVHARRDLIDTLETGTGSREQPLMIIITTAGVDDPGSIYTEKRDYAEKVAGGELDDPEWLTVIFTIEEGDDPHVEASWKKANPGYGRSLKPAYIARMSKRAQASPAALNTFLRLHLNVRTGQVTRWLPLDKWDRSGALWLPAGAAQLDLDDPTVEGRVAYAGLDLASSVDLAALAMVLPRTEVMELPEDPDDPESPIDEFEVEVLDVVVRAWTPRATLEERAARDRAPYLKWVEDGWLYTSPGEVIDYDDIEMEAFDLADRLELRRLHFDRWGSKQIVAHLRDGGLDVYEMGQGYQSFSPPMKEAERLTLEQRIAHGHNPLLRWAVGALSVEQDASGNIKPNRDKSTGRIDPWVALVMAIDAWSRDTQGGSVYEERGMASA